VKDLVIGVKAAVSATCLKYSVNSRAAFSRETGEIFSGVRKNPEKPPQQ
jgi:hypothetical protein